MKINYLVFILIVFALRANCSRWNWVMTANGTLSVTDSSTTIEDSMSTLVKLNKDVRFYLFTPANPTEPQQIHLEDDAALAASNFNASLPTRILIHGWQNSATSPIVNSTRDAYLASGDYNVIAVDWSSYASLGYIYARTKIITVGKYVALIIDYLELKGMNPVDLIVAGHSLGAHVSGNACRHAAHKVPILLALDPAGPLFYLIDTKARLRSTDADFVQVIHTSAGALGYYGNLGDADIWVNGGSYQKGCGFDLIKTCAHSRSYAYSTESISRRNSTFTAHRCENYGQYKDGNCDSNEATHLAGRIVDVGASGTYYVSTNRVSPFAKG